jgi:hypothetical protein
MKMRNGLFALWIFLCSLAPASAQVSVEVWLPGASIGMNIAAYPELVRVPGYPVYYAPQVNSNLFFYDGLYWAYQRDNWYRSSWYNGPWWLVNPESVPLFVLRVPVRYYRHAPAYFRGWRSDAPPHWGEHWGSTWEKQRAGWDNWNRSSVPAPAPLPSYQRQYSGSRYPHVEQQYNIQSQNYRYQPRENVVQQHYEAQKVHSAPVAPAQSRPKPPQQGAGAPQDQHATTRPSTPPQGTPPPQGGQPQQKGHEGAQKQQQPQRNQPGSEQREKESPGQGKDKEDKREGDRGK